MEQATCEEDHIPAEIDFSKGTRGKFAKPGTVVKLTVYLAPDVEAYLTPRTAARGVDVDQLVNELLKRDIELIETAN